MNVFSDKLGGLNQRELTSSGVVCSFLGSN